MNTHLIVAVHGIGEQQPGETVNEIVGAATTQIGKNDPLFQPVTVDRDVMDLADVRLDTTHRSGKFFPVHLRKVRHAKKQSVNEQAVFAEVFWADKSPAPNGAFWTIFDLLKIVLGLGYLAMENAESNRGKVSIGLVHMFIWVFYGLVAPMNAMLLIGCLFLLLDLTPLWDEFSPDVLSWIIAGHGIFTLAIGLFVRLVLSKTYLVRVFGNGLSLIGAGVLLTLCLATFWTGFDSMFCTPRQVPAGVEGPVMQPTLTRDIDCYANYLLGGLGITWVVNVICAMLIAAIGLTGALAGRTRRTFPTKEGSEHTIDDKVTGMRSIFPSICAAMVLFWSVIASSLWLLFLNISSQLSNQVVREAVPASQTKADDEVDQTTGAAPGDAGGVGEGAANGEGIGSSVGAVPDPEFIFAIKPNSLLYTTLDGNIRSVLQTMSVTTAVFIALILVTGGVVAIRKIWLGDLYKKSEWRSRLILNPVLHALFIVSLGLVALALAFIDRAIALDGQCAVESGALTILCWFHDQNAAVTALLLLLGIIIYRLSNHISGGLGIFRDIVTYSVQESCAWKADRDARAKNFTQRNQINARFHRTMHYSLEAYKPQRVTIIAHSLGSIIATRMLQDPDLKTLLEDNGNPEVILITMGSPATHIYRRYFKEFFQVSSDDMALTDTPDGTVNKAWYNIHREDDFVGTRIGDDIDYDAPDLAHNLSVPPGGHTGYFTDGCVWQVLREDVGFRLFPSQFGKPLLKTP